MAKGHTLVVADYGQLELRILAHMAECKSMITAFELGGDFHSRTALGMYDHIKEAINKGALFGITTTCSFRACSTAFAWQTALLQLCFGSTSHTFPSPTDCNLYLQKLVVCL